MIAPRGTRRLVQVSDADPGGQTLQWSLYVQWLVLRRLRARGLRSRDKLPMSGRASTDLPADAVLHWLQPC